MFFFQLVIMSGTVLLAYYMECTDLFSVHVQGFFCNDAELMKPYPGTEESSFVPPLILYCVVAAAPTAIVSKKKKKQKKRKGEKKKRSCFICYFTAAFKNRRLLRISRHTLESAATIRWDMDVFWFCLNLFFFPVCFFFSFFFRNP